MKRTELLLAVVATTTVLGLGAVAWIVLRAPGDAARAPSAAAPRPRPTEPEATLHVPALPAARTSEKPPPEPVATREPEPAPAPAPRRTALVSGRIVDPNGLPLGDVVVEVRWAARRETLLARARTDGRGAFAFELELAGSGFQDAVRRGYFAGRSDDEDEVERMLRRIGNLDPDARPGTSSRAPPKELARLHRSVSGEARPAPVNLSTFELELRAQAVGFVPHALRFSITATGERSGIELTLSPGGYVVGRVDPPGAQLWLLDEAGAIAGVADTDEHGAFLLGFSDAGTYHVFARGFAGRAWRTGLTLSPLAPSALEVLTLAGEGTILGRVVYGDGRPVADVEVAAVPIRLPGLEPPDAPWSAGCARTLDEIDFFEARTRTLGNGGFLLQRLQPGSYRPVLPEALHGEQPRSEAQTDGRAVELVYDGARLVIDAVLADDATGPLEIGCGLQGVNGFAAPAETQWRTFDAPLARVVHDVLPGGTYRVEARGPDGARTVRLVSIVEPEHSVELVVVPGRERELERGGAAAPALLRVRMIDLDARAESRRLARDADGHARSIEVRGLELTLRDPDGNAPDGLERRPVDRGWLELPAGTWQVELAPGDGYWIPAPLLAAELDDGALELGPGEVHTLQLWGRQGGRVALTVAGDLVLADAQPRVVAVDADDAGYERTPDARGRLDPLPAGTYTLVVSAPSMSPAQTQVTVEAGATAQAKVTLHKRVAETPLETDR